MRCACSTAGSASCQERDDSPWHSAVHDSAFLKWTALIHMWVAYITGSRRAGSGVRPPRAALSSSYMSSVCVLRMRTWVRAPYSNNRSDDKSHAQDGHGERSRAGPPAAGGAPRGIHPGARAQRREVMVFTPRNMSACQPRHRTYRDIVSHTLHTHPCVWKNEPFCPQAAREARRPYGKLTTRTEFD